MATRSDHKSTATKAATQHATFVIDRVFDASPAQVFTAFADPVAKARWFGGTLGEWNETEREFAFRVGGRERVVGQWASGSVTAFDCHYQDIVPNQRIVYTYDMHMDDHRLSVSLSTVELQPEGVGTRMRYTEQAAFLDGYDDAGSRERGTRALFDKLGDSLQHGPVSA